MKKSVKIVFMSAVLMLMLSLCCFGASALETTGQCGDNVYWSFDESTGELVISGEGEMMEIDHSEGQTDSPFYASEIKSLVVEYGVTTLSDYAFYYCTNLESVIISNSVTTIGSCAFAHCDNLKTVSIGSGMSYIGAGAFYKSESINTVYYDGTLEQWRYLRKGDGNDIILYYEYYDISIVCTDGILVGSGNDYENTLTIALGETKTIDVTSGEITYLEFTPDTSGAYRFYSSADSYTCGYLFDEDFNEIVYKYMGGENNFSVLCELQAGETYYWGACYSDEYESGSFDVTLDLYEGNEGVKTIVADEPVDIYIGVGETVYFEFVAPLTGQFRFMSYSDFDTYGYLLDSDGNVLDEDDGDYDFNLIFDAEAGEVFNLAAKMRDDYDSGVVEINLYLESCYHTNTTEYEEEKSTCTEEGLTSGTYCNDCGSWTVEREPIPLAHVDSDSDKICDLCDRESIIASGESRGVIWVLYADGLLKYSGVEVVRPIPQYYKSYVTYIEFQEGVSILEWYAFKNTNIVSITIPETVGTIAENSFFNCQKLEEITILNNSIRIDAGAFYECPNLKDVYFNGTEEQWNNLFIGSSNEDLLNATIHFLGEECTHSNKVEHDKQNATCTVNGYTAGVYCPDCEEWLSGHEVIEAKHSPVTYTQNATCGVNGYKLTSCSVCGESLDYEIIPAGEHEFSSWAVTKKSTCTVDGEESRSCSICGETETRVVTAPGHSWSAWTITEATLMSAGEKTRSCSVCGEAERVVLPKLEGEVAEDKNSGVKVEYTDDSYNGKDMNVIVEEDFTGSQYLGMSYGNFVSWNIKTYVNGAVVQPDAPVLVTIPIPSDFNKNMIVVYHVDSVTGNLEKIEPVIIEGDTIKFLASSFSIYMVVDESSVIEENLAKSCDCKCHKSGFMGFIWKIINFFNKLFKINKTCACGEVHY